MKETAAFLYGASFAAVKRHETESEENDAEQYVCGLSGIKKNDKSNKGEGQIVVLAVRSANYGHALDWKFLAPSIPQH